MKKLFINMMKIALAIIFMFALGWAMIAPFWKPIWFIYSFALIIIIYGVQMTYGDVIMNFLIPKSEEKETEE